MSWSEIKRALNSTLGTGQFQPLNEVVKKDINLLKSSVESDMSDLQNDISKLSSAIRNEMYESYYDFFLTQQDIGETSISELLVLPHGKVISDAAYSGSSARRIIIPNTYSTISSEAFAGCRRLLRLTIPDSVIVVGSAAFWNCDALNEIVIGEGLRFVDVDAFSNCFALKRVYYRGTEEQWSKISIGSGNSYLTNAEIYFNS